MSPNRIKAPIPPWAVTPARPPGFRLLGEAQSVVYWETDRAGGLVPTAGDWDRFPGCPPGQGRGADWLKDVVKEDRKDCRAAWKGAVKNGSPMAFLFRMAGSGPRPRWIRSRAVPVPGEDGVRLSGSFEDITPEMEGVITMHEGWSVTLSLLDYSPLPTSVVSMATGELLYSNLSLKALLGVPEALAGKLDPAMFYADKQDLEALKNQVAQRGLVEDFECRMKTLDGTGFWASLTARRIIFMGTPVRIVTIRDITNSKAMLDRLAESERRFRHLFEQHSAIMLLVLPQDGRILDANPSACAFYGYSLDQIRRMTIHGINDLEPGALADELSKAITRKVNHFTFSHRLASGERRVVEVESVPIEWSGLIVLFSIVHDITERRLAEEALKRSEMVLKQAQDLGGMGHFILDAETGAVETSAMLDHILGLPPGEPRTLDTLRGAIHPAFLQELLSSGSGTATSREVQGEFSLRSDDPRLVRWVQVRALLETPRSGQGDKVLGTVLDITQRRHQEMLGMEMEAQVAKGRMAAYIAHEINGPLAGIKNAFLLVESALPPDHPDRRYADLIKEEIKRISTIVKMLYELNKPVDPNPEDVAVGKVLGEIRTLLVSYARTRRVEIVQSEKGLDATARLNVSAIRQLLYNLIQNAIEASPAGGKVTCEAELAAGTLRLSITDEGPGVPADLTERIWDQGFTTKGESPQGGLGLGLATCMRLVTCMGGTLQFRNGAGGGCTFTALVPEAKAVLPKNRLEVETQP